MDQLALDLSRPAAALGRSDFLVSDSNRAAVDWIERWPEWPASLLVVHGPPQCGKTHLARLWCKRAGAACIAGPELNETRLATLLEGEGAQIAVEDADGAPERRLLHLYNALRERGGCLLATARRPPGSWSIALADLRSRLYAAALAAVTMPDDALLAAILIKHFADRQLRVRPPLIAYLINRIERSFAAAAEIVATLDAAALAAGQPVSIALASRVLDGRDGQSLPPGSEFAGT